jgi:hypothetical protein
MSMPNPTFRHTPFVVGDFESDYDEVTANIKGRTLAVALRKRF